MAGILHGGSNLSLHSHGHSHAHSHSLGKAQHTQQYSPILQNSHFSSTLDKNNLSIPSSHSSQEHSRTNSFSKSLKENFLSPSDALNIVHRLSVDGQLIRSSIDHNELDEVTLAEKINKLDELRELTESDLIFDSKFNSEASSKNINIRAALLHVIGGKFSFICKFVHIIIN